MELNSIYNEDCFDTMGRMADEGMKVDLVLTSPPYNTARSNCDFVNDTSKGRYTVRYVDFNDMKSDKEYTEWTLRLFRNFDTVLRDNGVVLYNMSYGKNTHESFWNLISDIQRQTPFTVADHIVWKKRNAVPNTASPNKLTRICEDIFVFVRKDEYDTFTTNKKVVSYSMRTNQRNYENICNFVSAANNDGSCRIHKATYSTELCQWLLGVYAPEGSVVYDPFIGTGTTAVACLRMGKGLKYIGSEIYGDYVNFAKQRLSSL